MRQARTHAHETDPHAHETDPYAQETDPHVTDAYETNAYPGRNIFYLKVYKLY